MEKKRNLIVNSTTCDISEVSRAVLDSYESIIINSAVVFDSPSARELIAGYNVKLNCGQVLEKTSDTAVSFINGSHEISASTAPNIPTVLNVNGSLTIRENSKEALKNYILINVNGNVTYPESMSPYLGNMKVNGSSNVYPDGSVLLAPKSVIDRTFALRARNAPYYAKKRVVMVSGDLDISALIEKGVKFITDSAVIAESYIEKAISLFDNRTALVIVPDGCSYVEKSAKLTDSLIQRYGTRLYIDGSLTVTADGAAALGKIQYLYVNGDINIVRELSDTLFTLKAEYRELKLVKGFILEDKVSVIIDKGLLDMHPSGITVTDCVTAHITSDISPELIMEKLEFKDCVTVECSSVQRSAVETVSKDVVSITDGTESDEEKAPETCDELTPIIVNVSSYKL